LIASIERGPLLNFSIYPRFTVVSFIRQAGFRVANLSGLFTSTFFMLFRTSIFAAIYAQGTKIGGYSLGETLSYVVLVQALIMVIPQWGSIGVQEDIRTGQIAMDLCRPLNYYLMIMCKRLGLSGFFLIARGIPTLFIGYALGLLTVAPSVVGFCYGIIGMLLGVWLTNSLHFLVELSGFWLESPRGPKMLVVGFSYFLSGATFPVALFPPWAQQINSYLPFSSTLNAPVELFLGTRDPLVVLGSQLLWVLIATALCFVVLRWGERKVVLHGG
jgi:ABC-2 type transport system permease protein